jgi:hypothetical protein
VDGGDFGGDFVDEDGIDAEALARGQGFSRDLEEDSFVHIRFKYRMGGGRGEPAMRLYDFGVSGEVVHNFAN